MKIISTRFFKSSEKLDQLPTPNLPEYAFVGRSNVGKSSLINRLCDRRSLAKTSGTPGKTQLINHFLINENWYLVDLPGYGYAKVSKTQRGQFQVMITDYLMSRTSLMNTFVLVDSRIPPQEIDLSFMTFLGEVGLPFSIVFTKTDKVKPGALTRQQQEYEETLYQTWDELPPRFYTSAVTGRGMDELLDMIETVNGHFLDGDVEA
ncbi:MAG: ribosome biogenesis GTP-binding protein YihA/YsxC [Bacteroidia bacterium]|nr:ribosome biogenesis GTP-binding protein YihA/YsxC [Bacteroidia bacterium]